jgi:hypothetical protein
MKTDILLKSLFLAGLLTASTTLMATDPAPRSKAVKTERTIREYFRFPSFINQLPRTGAGKVEVLFTTGSDGRINFVLAKSDDAKLKRMVEEHLTGLRLEELTPDFVHSVVLSFRRL